MREIAIRWRRVVDELKHDPGRLTSTLDPFIKMRLYSHILEKRGMTMAYFAGWCGAISLVQTHLADEVLPARGVKGFLRERLPFVSFILLKERMEKQHLAWSQLRDAIALWRSLMNTDLQYHDISEYGLYWRLRQTGAVNSRLVSDADIARAMQEPPTGTRASVRGSAIAEIAQTEGGTANWSMVSSATRSMDLRDPFIDAKLWTSLKQPTKRK